MKTDAGERTVWEDIIVILRYWRYCQIGNNFDILLNQLLTTGKQENGEIGEYGQVQMAVRVFLHRPTFWRILKYQDFNVKGGESSNIKVKHITIFQGISH